MKGLIRFGFMAAILVSCRALPEDSPMPSRKIQTHAGPEDMDIDSANGNPVLLIACDDRRCKEECPPGLILRFDLMTRQMDTLPRVGEPTGLKFHPHGVDVVPDSLGSLLFVVNHPDAFTDAILVYRISAQSLHFLKSVSSPHFTSPNAVVGVNEDLFWVSNDRWDKQKMGEVLMSKAKSRLVQNQRGNQFVAGHPVAFGNGVVLRQGRMYQAATRGNAIFKYEIRSDSVTQPSAWCKLTGPDNLREDGEAMLVACHLRGMKFMKHAMNAKNISPTAVYRVPWSSGKPELLFFDSGDDISAGSTAIHWQGRLYISQVFEPFILEVDLN